MASSSDKGYSETIDSTFLRRELHHTIRDIDFDIWVTRIVAFSLTIGVIYIAFIGYPDVYPLLLDCIVLFAAVLAFINSEISLQVMKKSATPITIHKGKLWIRPSSLERLRRRDGNIDIKDISIIKIRMGGKPHAPFGGTFFLNKTTSRASELEIILTNSDSRYSGSKPSETVNQIVRILGEDYQVKNVWP